MPLLNCLDLCFHGGISHQIYEYWNDRVQIDPPSLRYSASFSLGISSLHALHLCLVLHTYSLDYNVYAIIDSSIKSNLVVGCWLAVWQVRSRNYLIIDRITKRLQGQFNLQLQLTHGIWHMPWIPIQAFPPIRNVCNHALLY